MAGQGDRQAALLEYCYLFAAESRAAEKRGRTSLGGRTHTARALFNQACALCAQFQTHTSSDTHTQNFSVTFILIVSAALWTAMKSHTSRLLTTTKYCSSVFCTTILSMCHRYTATHKQVCTTFTYNRICIIFNAYFVFRCFTVFMYHSACCFIHSLLLFSFCSTLTSRYTRGMAIEGLN